MSDVVLSGAIRANLLSMQNTAKLLSETNVRLATGLKVNSAIDDPTAFFTARSLDTRATDLTNLLDQMDQAVQTLTAADEGIKSLTKLVETAKATATQALDTPINASFVEGPRDKFPDQTLKLTAVFSSIASTEVITVAFGGGTAKAVLEGGGTRQEKVSDRETQPGRAGAGRRAAEAGAEEGAGAFRRTDQGAGFRRCAAEL